MFCAGFCRKGAQKEVIPESVKIDTNKIPPKGILTLEEDISASSLNLETEIIKFRGPIKIKARLFKIANTVSVSLSLNALMSTQCSRCLNDFEVDLKKSFKLNYPVNKLNPIIDLNEDIRQEIILDYPLKPLCKSDCKGLCHRCGKNLNEGPCICKQ